MGDPTRLRVERPWHDVASGSVVVAVDASPDSAEAVRWAAQQATLEHRPLVVVAAADTAPLHTDDRSGWLAEARTLASYDLVARAHAVAGSAADAARQVCPDLAVHAVAPVGDAGRTLVDLSLTAHLIVMGCRGRGRLRSLGPGSVSAVVGRHATCPVVLCRRGSVPAGRGIVVTAGTPESRPAVEFAFAFAELRHLPLTVVHALGDAVIAVGGTPLTGDAESALANKRRLGHLAGVLCVGLAASVAGIREKYPDVAVTLDPLHGLLEDDELRRSQPWDLIVLGRPRLDSVDGWVRGAITNGVLQRASTTVAVVPETAGGDA